MSASKRQARRALGLSAQRLLGEASHSLGARGQHKEQRRVGDEPDELLGKRQRRPIGPVQVVEREDDRRVASESANELENRVEDRRLQVLGTEAGDPGRVLGARCERERRAQERAQVVVAVGQQLAKAPLQKLADRGVAVIG